MIVLDIEMPERCGICPFRERPTNYCPVIKEYVDTLASWAGRCRPTQCKLKEVADE